MIEFESVSKSFWTGKSRKVILDRASFRVELGNSLGILAPNGTGKTTIINMMAGLEKPDEGKITRTSRISFPLGFMGGVVNRHTATENSRYIARLYGLDPDYVEAFCRWLCDIAEYFDMPVGTYSQGMRARFSFALMLAMEFDIYLIDDGDALDHRCQLQPQGRIHPARPAEKRDRGHRLASGADAGKILPLGRRADERAACHVRYPGRG